VILAISFFRSTSSFNLGANNEKSSELLAFAQAEYPSPDSDASFCMYV